MIVTSAGFNVFDEFFQARQTNNMPWEVFKAFTSLMAHVATILYVVMTGIKILESWASEERRII